MTSGIDKEGDTTPRSYHLGDFFAQLSEPGRCLAVEVGNDFWERGVPQLPPGRLVSLIESSENWESWERHPNGEEFILQLTGSLELILDLGHRQDTLTLNPNDFAIVPQGVWHTANVPLAGHALYITPGEGTEHRRRD